MNDADTILFTSFRAKLKLIDSSKQLPYNSKDANQGSASRFIHNNWYSQF